MPSCWPDGDGDWYGGNITVSSASRYQLVHRRSRQSSLLSLSTFRLLCLGITRFHPSAASAMSKEFAQSFFPSFTTFLSSPDVAPSFLVEAWSNVFPDDVTSLCSEPSHTFILQRPCLAMAATIGAFVGLNLGYRSRLHCKNVTQSRSITETMSIHESWSKSATAFGYMNLAAFAHHCITPLSPPYENEISTSIKYMGNILWGADCIFTGISSINLSIMAWLVFRRKYIDSSTTTTHKDMIKWLKVAVHVILISIAATLAILWQLLYTGHVEFWAAASTFVELFYLVPVEAAALCLFPPLIVSALNVSGECNKDSIVGAWIAIFGGVVLVLGVVFDAQLCYFVSDNLPSIKASPILYDMFNLVTLVFLGCDIAFLGLNIWVHSLTRDLVVQKGKEQ